MPLRKRNLLTEVQYLFRALFAFCLPVWPDVVCRITRANLSVPHPPHHRLGRTAWFLPLVVQSLSHSDPLQLCGLQHASPLCPALAPGAGADPCPSSRRCCPATSSSVVPFSPCSQSFSASGSFSSELALHIRWLKY